MQDSMPREMHIPPPCLKSTTSKTHDDTTNKTDDKSMKQNTDCDSQVRPAMMTHCVVSMEALPLHPRLAGTLQLHSTPHHKMSLQNRGLLNEASKMRSC